MAFPETFGPDFPCYDALPESMRAELAASWSVFRAYVRRQLKQHLLDITETDAIIGDFSVRICTLVALGKAPGTDAERWLWAVLRNVTSEHIRRLLRQKRLESPWPTTSPGDAGTRWEPSDPRVSNQRDFLEDQLLRDCVSKLPHHLRIVVELFYFHGLTKSEIARALGIPPRTISSRLSAALQRIRRCLARKKI